MNKEKIRKVLSKVGVAGLATTVGIFTSAVVNAGNSCGKGSCGSKKVEASEKAEDAGKTSCGAGMKKSETKKEEMTAPAKKETKAKKKKNKKEAKSSCSK
ncbi:MAG: hypothetical protein COV46_03460 [Deltaproteobacteria bacterium CG11_big_fil_rev_8_21_14_0_20_49_13]|nr:MAG: hypothetical protein COV46_03460 [Deltaproteobacteria bacterium CG11_big_fil_rev_8_21_14_0_20_49_13]